MLHESVIRGLRSIITKVSNSDVVGPLAVILTILFVAWLIVFSLVTLTKEDPRVVLKTDTEVECTAGYLRFKDTKVQVVSTQGSGVSCTAETDE